MRAISRAIDRFCYSHPRFGIPNLMRLIVFGTAAVYVLLFVGIDLTSLINFSPYYIFRGQIWRLVTFIFVPTTRSLWFVIVIYMYYMIGTTLEQQWGTAKFSLYYLICMGLFVVFGLVLYLLGVSYIGSYVSVSYINLSLFLAFSTLYPDVEFRIMFILPIRAKWIGLISAASFLIGIFQAMSAFPANLLPLVTLITYLLFCWDYLMDYIRPYSKSTSQSTINFKRASKKVQREQKNKPYNRKCSVCGRTDTDFPDLEFRYCSRCEGYHCFCLDHINNHKHYTK